MDHVAMVHCHQVLTYMSVNIANRNPICFIIPVTIRKGSTQGKVKPYLNEMTKKWMRKEIDRDHEIGIEVFVVDAGWFGKIGKWIAIKERFPVDLKEVKAKMDSYGMKMVLLFNSDAAVTSDMLAKYMDNKITIDGKANSPHKVWEKEESYMMCLVSPLSNDYAEECMIYFIITKS